MFTLITGGSASGKSEYAESLITNCPVQERFYVATMHPFDEESYRRIDRHRAMRAQKGFQTIEAYTGLKNVVVPAGSQVLLECMSNLVANEMYEETGAGVHALEEILSGIRQLMQQTENLVVVTNEISSDLQDYSEETVRYISLLGKVNRQMSQMADRVVEVVYGIPVEVC